MTTWTTAEAILVVLVLVAGAAFVVAAALYRSRTRALSLLWQERERVKAELAHMQAKVAANRMSDEELQKEVEALLDRRRTRGPPGGPNGD